MKNILYITLLAISLVSISFAQVSTSGSGWTWYNPIPQGNGIYSHSIAPDGTDYLCGEHGTLLKSTDNGNTYTPMTPVGEKELNEIIVIENSLKVVVVGEDGARLTTNGGGIWVSYAPGYTNLNCIDKKNNNVVIGGDNGKIITSSNSGETFSETLNSPGYTDFKRIIYMPVGIGVFAIGTNGKIFYSFNGGYFWGEVTNPSGGADLFGFSFANANTGMIVGAYGKVLKTTNGGVNWYLQVIGSNQDLYDVRMLDANTALATGANGKIFRTTDGGSNWAEIYSHPSQFDLYLTSNTPVTPDFIFVWGEKGIKLTSTDAGVTWTDETAIRLSFSLMFPTYDYDDDHFNSSDGDSLFAVGNSGLFSKTTNAGNTWATYNTGTTLDLKSGFFVNSQTGWLVGGKSSPLQRIVLKTSNGGINWVTQHTANSNNLNDLHFFNQTTGITVGNFGVILRTTNSGQNWSSIFGVTWTLNKLYFLDSTKGIAVGEAGRIFRTTNAGLNWVQVNSGAFFDTQFGVDFINANTGVSVGSNGVMYRTTNSGLNWVQLPQITLNALYSISFADVNTGYACGTNLGNDASVLKTTNGGLNWVRQNSGTNNILSSILFINSTTGFAVGEAGTILKTTNGGTPIGITQTTHEIPKQYLLSQNYPNPFNPVTNIRFSVPKTSVVSLKIFDITGREVAELINQTMGAGTYNYDFNASHLSSGVYFYRMTAGDFTEVRKMVLIK